MQKVSEPLRDAPDIFFRRRSVCTGVMNSRAAVAVGADGLMVEVHNDPDRALSDGPQSLTLEGFEDLMQTLEQVLAAVGRPLARPRTLLQATA